MTLPRVLAVIPARGGSKGVPRKNTRVIAGRSLLARAVDAARAAAMIDTLVVSTDDSEMAAEAEKLGVGVIERPSDLASDTATTPPVVIHALDVLAEPFDVAILLQPPAPLRTGAEIDAALTLLIESPHLDSVVSVYEVGDVHPGRMYRLGADGVLDSLHPELEQKRRQDLPEVYHRNGAIYAVRVGALRSTGSLLAGAVGAVVMDAKWTVNIDTPADLPVAEIVVARWDERQR